MGIAKLDPHFRKEKESHEWIFSWLSLLYVLLVSTNDDVPKHGGHTSANRLTKTYIKGVSF